MNIDGSITRKQVGHDPQSFGYHSDERICPPAPSVPISNLFNYARSLGYSLLSHVNIYREVGTYIERGINIDQLQPSGCLDLSPQPPALKRGQHQLIVAPDQLVGPTPR